jgi:hypothetical protein
MRLVAIVVSVSALTFASGAMAQKPNPDQKTTNIESENPRWYSEPTPYRPCPVVATINGRDVCLGCPSRCPWGPPFAKQR